MAELEPVFLAGTTVKRAGLHNVDEIQRKDVRVGATVIVEKAGEIIPQVVRVLAENRPKHAKKTKAPTHCPSCRRRLIREEDEVAIRCVNPTCPAQMREKLIWFAMISPARLMAVKMTWMMLPRRIPMINTSIAEVLVLKTYRNK